ncbi:hypothetical protein BGZ72_007404 [Mortierella alpina]|nr:hypothetical protein BGZ72_007404 [Mortierella alpina]
MLPRPESPSTPAQTRQRRTEPYPQPVAAQRAQRRSPRSAQPSSTAAQPEENVGFFERLDRVMESIAEEDAGRVPRHLETGPQVQVQSFGKKRRIQRDSSHILELASTTQSSLVSPSPSSSSFSSSSSLDMPRLRNRNNVAQPASANQAVVVPSSMQSDPSLSLMIVPSSVQSEASLPELFVYETPTPIARQPRPVSPPLSPVLELAVISGSRESTPGVADNHTVHSPRASGSWAPTLPLSLSPTMGSQTPPQQDTPSQQEAHVQQETAPQHQVPVQQETLSEVVPASPKHRKPYSKKSEPIETVATRIGARRRITAIASRGASSSSAAPTEATTAPRRQKSVIDLDEDKKTPAPTAEPAPRLSGVKVYVIPVNMDKVIFNLSRLHVLQLNGQWLGPEEKILATDPRVAPSIPKLDQEETTHIVTELTSMQAVKTYLGVDAINPNIHVVNRTWLADSILYKRPMDAKGYALSRLTSRPTAEESAKSPPEDTPPPSQPAATAAATSSSTPATSTTRMEQERFAKFQSTEDGQPLQFHEIVQGINEGSLDDTAISDAGETEEENDGQDQEQEQGEGAPQGVQHQEHQQQGQEQGSKDDKQSPPSEKDQVLLQIINSGKSEGKRRARILYQCQSPHAAGQKEEPAFNKAILEQLKTLMDHYDTIKTKGSKEHYKVINYRKAITAIRALDYEITSEAMALKVPRVGKKIAQKIGECIALGKIKKLDHLNWDQDRSRVETLFRSIYGVGSEMATDWYNKGLRTLEDVRKLPDLTKNQISGLKYYDDLLQRVPRAEVEEIGKVVTASATKLHPDIQVHVTGSYRRGQPDCGDIDMVVARPDIDFGGDLFVIMDHILKDLISQGFLVDHLSLPVWSDDMEGQMKHFKYMGICKLPGEGHVHHHIDILVVPWMHLGAVLLYFTGNDICNRSMRLLAANRGMRLSDKGLFAGVIRGKNRKKINEGHWVAGRTEKEIFDYLKIKYLEPHEREC